MLADSLDKPNAHTAHSATQGSLRWALSVCRAGVNMESAIEAYFLFEAANSNTSIS
jgi:hypothetical protein